MVRKLTEKRIKEQVDKFKTLEEAIEWLRFIESGGEPSFFGKGIIVCFGGGRNGAGTVAAVASAYNEFTISKAPVYSNLKLNFPYKHLRKINFDTVSGSIILIDDAFIEFNCRETMSLRNKLWSFLFMQSKKRGLKIFMVTPDISFLDLRIRRSIEIIGRCSWINDRCKVCLQDRRTAKRFTYQIPSQVYSNLYDTNQFIPLIKKGGKNAKK